MSRSLRTLRMLVVVAAILASNACMGNPFGPGDVVIPSGAKPTTISCANSANAGTRRCLTPL